MKLLQINQLSKEGVETLKPSFDNLPETDHKDGKFRLRRYSVFDIRTTFWDARTEAHLDRVEHRDFVQGDDINKFQGNMKRNFEEIEDSVAESQGMKELALLFKETNNLVGGHEVEVHQMRIVIRKYSHDSVPPAPEGVHQDGFDRIAIVSVNRDNVQGGAVQVFRSQHGKPLLDAILKDGEVVNLDDKHFWHFATEIDLINPTKDGTWDAFVITTHL